MKIKQIKEKKESITKIKEDKEYNSNIFNSKNHQIYNKDYNLKMSVLEKSKKIKNKFRS